MFLVKYPHPLFSCRDNLVQKYIDTYTNYINGIDGRTEVITNHTASWATYNLFGLDAIGQIRRSGTTWNRFYFLKDHLGSIKVIVNSSGNVVAYNDFPERDHFVAIPLAC